MADDIWEQSVVKMWDQSPCLYAGSEQLEADQHNPHVLSVSLVSQKAVRFNDREATEGLLPPGSACCSNKL